LLSIAVVWAIYRRVRRNFGRQPVNARRLQVRIGVFAVLGALVLFGSVVDMALLGALIGGIACGATLAYFGLQNAKFEVTAQGAFLYTAYLYRSVRHRIVRQSRGFPLPDGLSEPVHGVTVEPEPFRCVSEEFADHGDFRRIDRLLRSFQLRRAEEKPRPCVVGDGRLEFVAAIQLSGPDSYKNVRGYSNNNQ
jgi:cbb3-type cytochrome oxidase subunit 3